MTGMRRWRVAIVEDDDDLRLIDGLMFPNEDVTTFADGQHAIAADWTLFDAALFDVMLGSGPSGIDVARHALEQNPDLKVLILTGAPNLVPEDLRDRASTKPTDLPTVRRMLGLDDG